MTEARSKRRILPLIFIVKSFKKPLLIRMITGTRSTDHTTPVLKNLHWLPVEARINFNILLITYKILNGQSTSYLEPII